MIHQVYFCKLGIIREIVLFLFCCLFSFHTYAFSLNVTQTEAGSLIGQIDISRIEEIDSLTIRGDLNGTDILVIRKMTKLVFLDISETKIVNGGQSYYENYTTSENKLGDYFFKESNCLNKIILPKSIDSIGNDAFADCGNLASIVIPNNVLSIGKRAFNGCAKLTSVIIEDGIEKLQCFGTSPSSAFHNCNIESLYLGRNICHNQYDVSLFSFSRTLTSVTVGKLVTEIDIIAFRGCDNLTKVTIPNSVTEIGSGAFENCTSLTNITIPNSVTRIGFKAFQYCSCLPNIVIPNSVTEIGAIAFMNCSSLTNITLPNNITEISFETFQGCTSLTSINIPNSVTKIGHKAFENCKSLTSIVIPNSVEAINYHAFYSCTNLTSVTIEDGINTLVFEDTYSAKNKKNNDHFASCLLETLYLGRNIEYNRNSIFSPFAKTTLASAIIGDKVSKLGSCFFYLCKRLTSISIPNSVTEIGSGAFENCTSLTNITLPNNITEIGFDTFENCTSLTSISIPNSVTSIGNNTFRGCVSLTSVSIGNSVTSIGETAFYGCDSLKSVYSYNTTPPEIHATTFSDSVYTNATLYVPVGCKTIYWLHPYWEEFFIIQEDSVVGIDSVTFDGIEKGKKVLTIYTIDGIKCKTTSFSDLPSGIYVINGKKVVVK